MTKELSHVIMEPHNVRMELSNVRKKSKGTTKCEKKIVTYDVGTAQFEDETVNCEKKVREPPNVRKELSHVILELHNVRMELSIVRKKQPGVAGYLLVGTVPLFLGYRRITLQSILFFYVKRYKSYLGGLPIVKYWIKVIFTTCFSSIYS